MVKVSSLRSYPYSFIFNPKEIKKYILEREVNPIGNIVQLVPIMFEDPLEDHYDSERTFENAIEADIVADHSLLVELSLKSRIPIRQFTSEGKTDFTKYGRFARSGKRLMPISGYILDIDRLRAKRNIGTTWAFGKWMTRYPYTISSNEFRYVQN